MHFFKKCILFQFIVPFFPALCDKDLFFKYVMENDGTYASGCVVKCSAEPGEELPAGTTITVYIAADRDVIIPPTPTPSAEPTPTPIPDLEEDFD